MGVTQYIGSRYVPVFADPADWNSTRTYDPLTIVMHEGNSYTSKQYVPKGIDISNANFWAETGNYNAQVEAYRNETKETSEKITGEIARAEAAENAIIKETSEKITGEIARAEAAENAIINERYYVTPEMFGAVGDGITDDTSALTKALKNPFVKLGTGKTYLTEGQYVDHAISIEGCNSTLKMKPFAAGSLDWQKRTLLNINQAAKDTSKDDVVISMCYINGVNFNGNYDNITNRAAAYYGDDGGLSVNRCKKVMIQNCEFTETISNSIYVRNSNCVKVDNCVCTNVSKALDTGSARSANCASFSRCKYVVVNNIICDTINDQFIYCRDVVEGIFNNLHGYTFNGFLELYYTEIEHSHLVFNNCVVDKLARGIISRSDNTTSARVKFNGCLFNIDGGIHRNKAQEFINSNNITALELIINYCEINLPDIADPSKIYYTLFRFDDLITNKVHIENSVVNMAESELTYEGHHIFECRMTAINTIFNNIWFNSSGYFDKIVGCKFKCGKGIWRLFQNLGSFIFDKCEFNNESNVISHKTDIDYGFVTNCLLPESSTIVYGESGKTIGKLIVVNNLYNGTNPLSSSVTATQSTVTGNLGVVSE